MKRLFFTLTDEQHKQALEEFLNAHLFRLPVRLTNFRSRGRTGVDVWTSVPGVSEEEEAQDELTRKLNGIRARGYLGVEAVEGGLEVNGQGMRWHRD